MHLKPGVEIAAMTTDLLEGILKAFRVYQEAGQPFVITSLTDGRHMATSRHYSGNAFDLRIRNLRGKTPAQMAALLRAALGEDYDVVVENDHLHIEYDPKRR